MAAKRMSWTDTWISLLVFVGVLVVYILTLCPSLYPGDPLGAVTAATGTRFIKAVEYPVWRFVARLFMVVSPNKVWALNLLSAIFGAASIGLLYRIFARFSHTRTRDELVRFRGQPGLGRYAALAAALLVAFTQTFWRASILAGTDTLNMFMLLWATHLLLSYTDTRKKRYFILYAIVYAVGLANFPTMLLLLPIYLVLSIMWCPEVYRDLFTLGLTILAAAVVFAIAVFYSPARFASDLPGYFLSPLPVTTPLFEYVRWYWAHIRPVFPMGGLAGALSWLLWLVLPTLPPVMYLAFTKPGRRPEMGRGSAISDGIFRFLNFLYTLFGVMVLLDLVIGPYRMGGWLGFVVAYAVAGGWLCYTFGYWAIIFTGKLGAATSGSLVRHAKGGYVVLVAVLLLLPVASAAKHLLYDQASLAGFTLLEDFAKDTLRSAASAAKSPTETTVSPVILIVRDGWGDLLAYVNKYGRLGGDAEDAEIKIIDLSAATSGRAKELVDRYTYLQQELVGAEVPAQRDPRRAALSDAEAALRYIELGRMERPEVPAPRILFTSDIERYNPESASMDAAYEFVPRGLVYLLDLRASFASTPADHIEAGRAVWTTLALRALEDRLPGAEAGVVRPYLGRAAKLANDFGVYCHRYESQEAAVAFYRLALALDEGSYSALRNMKIAGEQVADLDARINDAVMLVDNRVESEVQRRYGANERPEVTEPFRRSTWALMVMLNYGLVRDSQLLRDFWQNIQDPQATAYAYRYAIISLRVMIDPDTYAALAERGVLYLSAVRQKDVPRSIRQVVQALEDLEAAAPHAESAEDKAEALSWIGEAHVLLRDAEGAERAFKEAIKANPDLAAAYNRLAEIYVATDRKDEAISLVRSRAAQSPPTTRDGVFLYLRALRGLYMAGDEPDPGGFMAEAEAFKAANPGQALNTGLFLVDVAMGEPDYERARTLIADLDRTYGSPSAVRLRSVQLANAEKRHEDALAIELDEDDPLQDDERIAWLRVRGTALLRLDRPAEALGQFEAAYTVHEAYIQRSFDELAARLQGDQRQLLETENRRREILDNVRREHSLALWYAAIQAYEQHADEALRQKVLRYAMMHYYLVEMNAQQTEAEKLLAGARYGWTQFRVQNNTRRAHRLLQMAALGLPRSALTQLQYGALLIAEGDVEQGIRRVAAANDSEEELDNYQQALADKLLEEHKDVLERLRTQPDTSGTPGTGPELDLEGEGSGDDENTDTDGETVNPNDL